MKLISFSGGLGNQIFEYAFYRYMSNKYENVRCVYRGLKEHNGLELDNCFQVNLPKPNLIYEICAICLGLLKKICPSTSLVDMSVGTACNNEDAIYIYGYKPDKKYLFLLSDYMEFNINNINEKNLAVIHLIENNKTVALHVRRGDYLSPRYAGRYVDLTATDYYRSSISIVKEHFEDAVFFIFSDDMEWCKNNLKIENITFVDWNKGKDSYIDMYLMSQCSAVITANSTFSFFGGLLGRKEKLVIYPDRWYKNRKTPDIFLDSWICVTYR